jgi:hypothetical protein
MPTPSHRSTSLANETDGIVREMRTARAKVVKGKIVTRAQFPEGTKLFLVVDKPQPEIELDEDDEKAFDEAMVAVRRGKTIPLETFRAILQRL